MPLRHEPDVSMADWIVGADEDWQVLATQGPPLLAAYATVRFDDAGADPYRPDPELVAVVTRLAADHTTTPDRAWFGLWAGWGELSGGRVYEAMEPHRSFGRLFTRPRPLHATPPFGPDVVDGPVVDLRGARSYLLFTGRVDDVGRWPARQPRPGWPVDLPQASLTWPQDRAWSIASDVDPTWFTVGGSRDLVAALLAHPDLRVEPATYGVLPPD